jgi:hypothetical protein
MSFEFYVVAYRVTTFPQDNPVRFLVFDGRRPCACPEACKHRVESEMLALARHEARALHKHGIDCGKGA